MIKSIKMQNCVPFQQAEIADCKKVNFIFGANGSGKSTISSFLGMYSEPSARFEHSSVIWDSPDHEKIEVYNRDFRRQNMQQDMPGIFTFGKATIDDIKEIDQLKNELSSQQEELKDLNQRYNKLKDEDRPEREARFKNDVWEHIYRKNAGDFSQAFEGLRGSRERFVDEVKRRKKGNPEHNGTICDKDSLLRRSQTLYSSKLEECLIFDFDDIQRLLFQTEQIRNDRIWNTVIVGNTDIDIASLIKELNNSSWVSQGRQYLSDQSKICPFCQQETITDEFRRKLESFFDMEYEKKLDYMKKQCDDYESIAKQIKNMFEVMIKDSNRAVEIGQLNVETYTTKVSLLSEILGNNIEKMKEKITKPENRISIQNISNYADVIINQLVDANNQIVRHNNLVRNHKNESERLKDDIWATCLYQSDSLITAYQEDMNKLEKDISDILSKISEIEQTINQLKFQIEEKGRNITSVEPAINKINRYLQVYGFTGFSIQPAEDRDNYYCIKRNDGTRVENTLSEGEETFLTFLYFMQKVDGAIDKDHVSDKKIIVLDDPICSLDSTVLYIVSSIVQNLIQNIKKNQCNVSQLFVLTHNIFFQKEASYPYGRNKENGDVHFWVIQKDDNVASITAYEKKNPITSTYEMLWRELKDNEQASIVSVQNIMRRIIEFYFMSLGGIQKKTIIDQFESIEDQLIVKSLFLWMNDGSHTIPDDLSFEPDQNMLSHYKSIFELIFKKSDHWAHYKMMMGISDESENAEQA